MGSGARQRLVAVGTAAAYAVVVAATVAVSTGPGTSDPVSGTGAASGQVPRAADPDPRSVMGAPAEPPLTVPVGGATPAPTDVTTPVSGGSGEGPDPRDDADPAPTEQPPTPGRPEETTPSPPARPTPSPTRTTAPAPAPSPAPTSAGPRITSFTVTANGRCLLLLGRESVTLRWSSVNATRGEIRTPSGLPAWVGAQGSMESCGRSGESFRLTVYGPEGEASAAAVVP
ncbi:hypothetical protein [Thalassiella azotivora]